MSKVFDGRKFANDLEKNISKEIRGLNVSPKLVSILVGDDKGSELYLTLKKKAAQRVGAKVEICQFSGSSSLDDIADKIGELNEDNSVHGIMIQLPLPSSFSKSDRDELIQLIKPDKDVDGLRSDSIYITPVSKAVIAAFKESLEILSTSEDFNICVVGSSGFEGQKIYNAFTQMGYKTDGVDRKSKNFLGCIKSAGVVVSATGSAGLIQEDMVKEGVVAIDVGSPRGDFDLSVYEKASFITPVPGGIGPMTISFLMENLLESAKNC